MFSNFSDKDLMDLLSKTESATLSGQDEDVIPDKIYDELVTEAKSRRLINEAKYDSPNGYFMGSIPKPESVPPLSGTIIISPKYDGVSCLAIYSRTEKGMTLLNANTRGVMSHGNVKCTDLTLIMKILAPILKCQNEGASRLVVRGEIVLTEKYILQHPAMKSPAAIASGMLNRKAINAEEILHDLCFRPYEVVEFVVNGNLVPVNQEQAYKFFGVPTVTIKPDLLMQKELHAVYTDFRKAIKEPIDGIVYSAPDWIYPAKKENRSTVNYGKFAYKPSSVVCSTVTNITPVIDSDGRFKFTLTYAPTQMQNGNISTKCTITATQLINNKDILGINSIVTIGFRQNLYPYMNSVMATPATIKYFNEKIKCPYCGHSLVLCNGVGRDTRIFKCSNDKCVGMIGYKLALIIKTYMHLNGVTGEYLAARSHGQLTFGWLLANCRFKHDKVAIKPSQAFNFMTCADFIGVFDCWWKSNQQVTNILLTANIPLSDLAKDHKKELISLVATEMRKPENKDIQPSEVMLDFVGNFNKFVQ